MKHFLFVAVAALFGSMTARAALSQDVPLDNSGTKTAVSISTSAFTLVPAASSLDKRRGLKVENLSTNNASILCTGAKTTTAPTGITIGDIEIEPGENPFIPFGNNLRLWCVSKHTAAETINVREYR